MSDIIFFSNVRLSFPQLAQPRASAEGAIPKYSGAFLMEPTHPNIPEFMKQYGELALAKWNQHATQVMQLIQNERKLRCYGPGEENVNSKTFQVYDGYPGMFVISANRENMPQMIKPDGTGVDPLNTMECQQMARSLYAGCYVNVALRPWLQDNKHGRGVRCDLVAVQFAGDGVPFGEGATDASAMFGAGASTGATTGQPTPAGATVTPGMPAMPDMGANVSTTPAMGMPSLPDFMNMGG